LRGKRKGTLVEALEATNGNQTRAAKILGVSRVTVWKWVRKYGIRLTAHVARETARQI
jgi:transcriptional regulator of acetoin/glycerol metabolism